MPYKNIEDIFVGMADLKVLIIGDVMLDRYESGKVERISPEAPVPVITLQKQDDRLGGAANVALNIQAFSATPVICSVIGDDDEGKKLAALLQKNGISGEGLVYSKERVTTVKKRILSGHQHLLRIDHENDHPLSAAESASLVSSIKKLLFQCDVVIMEDYDKGVITPEVIELVVGLGKQAGIPVTVDPKKRNFLSYKGVDLFKPNLKELREGLKIELDKTDLPTMDAAIEQLHRQLDSGNYLVTLSEKGVYFRTNGYEGIIPAHIRTIADVSGAGDTVIATASLALALRLPMSFVASLANLAGGLVCEKIGVVPIDKQQLIQEAIVLGLVEKYG